ncbi:MAG: zinc-binding dehydrogenase, partial [Gammaproteobacteria bacterium]|nr:zinc-binding dehydrogenase [Gammaproteobacteria bacterium]
RFSPFDLTTRNRSILGFNLSYLFDRESMLQRGMQDILARIENGELRLPSITPYPLDNVAAAHRDLESGQTTGKLVLVNDSK